MENDNQNNEKPSNPTPQAPVVVEKTSDFTHWELTQLGKYKDDGLPNVSKVTPDQLTEMFNMYMNGASYEKISNTVGLKKPIVLYFAERQNWYIQKQNYINDMASQLGQKIANAKLESVDHLVDTVYFFRDYFKDKFNSYTRTKDDRVADSIDTRFMPAMFKAMEMLQKLGEKDRDPDKPPVNVNIHGATSVSTDGNNLDINALSSSEIAAALSAVADMKRKAKAAEQKTEENQEKKKKVIIRKAKQQKE